MKVTLDLDRLRAAGSITGEEFERLRQLGARGTSALLFSILIAFGVIAVSGGLLALIPQSATAIALGAVILIGGLALGRAADRQWSALGSIHVLIGALMLGGGIVMGGHGSTMAFAQAAAVLGVAAMVSRSALLAVLAVLASAPCLEAGTAYGHATYYLVVGHPALTVGVYSALACAAWLLSRALQGDFRRLAAAAAGASVFLVNFAFWVGSLWGDARRGEPFGADVFAVTWGIALLALGGWAWARNRRWALNLAATFGGIHFYTQWFEHLHATPGSVLAAGVVTLIGALALRSLNGRMKQDALVATG